jgi:hypothetical protein
MTADWFDGSSTTTLAGNGDSFLLFKGNVVDGWGGAGVGMEVLN